MDANKTIIRISALSMKIKQTFVIDLSCEAEVSSTMTLKDQEELLLKMAKQKAVQIVRYVNAEDAIQDKVEEMSPVQQFQ